jgi:glyoxylase-like metal-dependent hydrolase (beta-lactamase superfamily II)
VPPIPYAHEVRVEASELADGVWLMGGGTHNSVAVEFADFIAVVEAPLNETRSLAVIEEIVRRIPGKPIRYVVNTHDHYDHVGGLRAYLHIGHRDHAPPQRQLLPPGGPEPLPLGHRPRPAQPEPPTETREGYIYELVQENYWLTDGDRVLHISQVQPMSSHAEGMLMAYLVNEGIAIEADLFDTHEPSPAAPRIPIAACTTISGTAGASTCRPSFRSTGSRCPGPSSTRI